MFSSLIEPIKTFFTFWTLSKLQAVRVGRVLIKNNWTDNHEVIKDFSPEFVKRQGELMMEEIVKVALSPNPFMANREKLSNCLYEMAQFQVLVIDPAPAEDRAGLRGQVGITGELKPRLFELYQCDTSLQEYFKPFDEQPQNWDDVWNAVLSRYRMAHAWTHVFHGLRFVFGDCDQTAAKDWFRPYLAAMSGFQESIYRHSLGMPSAFDKTSNIMPDMKPIMLSLYRNCVMDGAKDPDVEWNHRLADIEHGDSAWRANSWLA